MRSWLERVHAKASSWKLPVRVPVPNRDNLIAMGLMALAFGLMVGVALGPALGDSSNAGATAVPGVAAAVPETPLADEVAETGTEVPALGAPAGSEDSSSESTPESDETAFVPQDDAPSLDTSDPPADTYPFGTEPEEEYVVPEEKKNDNELPRSLPGTPLKGTVVSVGTNP
ncbi:MAG: hypothetical protein ACSLFD_11425, partial [Solirubrobacterales bacterium]